MIGVGSIAYLAIPNNLVGAFIFSVGLLTICMYGMNLYTGKIGYILINKTYYIWELFLTLVGNFTFILCGFEHSIANMAYFSIANVWNLEVVLYLLIMVLGNSIGSI